VYKDHLPILKRNDIDLAVDTLPTHLRVPVTLHLWKAGYNVLTEKPVAKTVKEMDRLIAAAKKAKKLFAIYQQRRLDPSFEQVKKVIRSGALGRITQITIAFNSHNRRWDWQTLTECAGGNLLNTGPHPLDQALRFLDLPTNQVPEIFCYMDNSHFFGDAEGHVNLMMRAPRRPLIYIEICSDCAYPFGTYNVYGTQGGLTGTPRKLEWRYFRPQEAPRRRVTMKPIQIDDGTPSYCTENLKWYKREWTVPKAQKDIFYTMGSKFYRMLYKHMTLGGPLVITAPQVRQQIAVIEESQRQNPHIWGRKT